MTSRNDLPAMETHLRCFRGESDYIPLAVKAQGDPPPFTLWEAMEDPRCAVENFLAINGRSLQVRSDWSPAIESNFLESLVPSLFGAQLHQSPGGLIEVRPFLDSLADPRACRMPDLGGGLAGAAFAHLEYLLGHPVPGVPVSISRFASPLDYAVMMRGGDFYLDLLTEPEAADEWLSLIAETTIRLIRRFKAIAGEPADSQITVRGFHFPGIRLTADAIVNLSPDLIRRFLFPRFEQFADAFGSVMLHYCTLPAPAGHVLPILRECPAVRCVDNWQGYRTFFDAGASGMLQNSIAVCTDLTEEQARDPNVFLREEPFYSEVPRAGGRGIAASYTADSIGEGQEIYSRWRRHFEEAGQYP